MGPILEGGSKHANVILDFCSSKCSVWVGVMCFTRTSRSSGLRVVKCCKP